MPALAKEDDGKGVMGSTHSSMASKDMFPAHLRVSASASTEASASLNCDKPQSTQATEVLSCVKKRTRVPSFAEFHRRTALKSAGTRPFDVAPSCTFDVPTQTQGVGAFSGLNLVRQRTWILGRNSHSTRRMAEMLRKAIVIPEDRKRSWYRVWAQWLVDQRIFVAITTLLTIFALTGSDIRLLATHKPADSTFDGLVIACIIVFSVELVLSCIGKEDYFMGFFFGLDFLSTITLFLDLTSVSDSLFRSDDDVDKARSGRTARLGAKAGRVVRVLRLIRIMKLYKAWYEARVKAQRARAAAAKKESEQDGQKEEDDWEMFGDDEDGEAADEGDSQESVVGKKLSAKTTQKTIILVLIMLMVLPMLGEEEAFKSPSSGQYAADDVQHAFQAVRANSLQGLRDAGAELMKTTYEESILKFLYYHNWFVGNHFGCPSSATSCSNWFYTHAFWVGIASWDTRELYKVKDMAQLREATVREWDEMRGKEAHHQYSFGTMPSQVLPTLWSPWNSSFADGEYEYTGFSLIGKKFEGVVDYFVQTPDDLRKVETFRYTPMLVSKEEYRSLHFVFYFDLRPIVRAEATMNLLITFFICIVLCVASLCLSNDANTLVLRPVENMVTKVEAIRANPLIAMKMADDDFKQEELRRMRTTRELAHAQGLNRLWIEHRRKCFGKKEKEIMETAILEKTITKLGSLVALGFGEAGAGIVSQTIKGSSTAVNVMNTGMAVDCIIGNARIGNFGIANVVLQGKVMTFVNQIAEIVHGVVDQCHGAANKNNGDTFVIIWRAYGLHCKELTKTAEMSIVAFSRILGAVHRSPVLEEYRRHPGLQQRLGSNCRVNITFGLHFGWAIEGAVGTEFKIDACYVSPNVTLASRLEHATGFYGVSILASDRLIRLCRLEMVEKMRLIDKVIIKGSKNPMELYCVDLCYADLQIDEPMGKSFVWNTRQRFRSRQLLEHEKERMWSDEVDMVSVFEEARDIAIMRELYTDEFRELFDMGYQNYSQGEWQVARQYFTKTVFMLGRRDGPSFALLRFMESPMHGLPFVAPDGWRGVHDISDFQELVTMASNARRRSVISWATMQ